MKKILIVLFALLSIASAEILVNGIDLANIEEQYIKLNIKYWNKSKEYYAYVDYGQNEEFRDQAIVLENGDKRGFDSTIEILNFLYKNGWETKFMNTYYTDDLSGKFSFSRNTYYILEKRVEK